mgnify:CR=1 FL=1
MIPSLYGFEDEEGVRIEIESTDQVEVIETDKMNPLELACVRGWTDVVKYFVNELGLKDRQDFNPDHKSLKLEHMYFVFVPIVRKDAPIFSFLLDQP